ncbi:hypothetical protein V5O48_004666 [Marasmius crinis-equi]|uniref:Amidohydrolase-related domain-containing protein n=1 Tax=Marasmius crinis-equi TaxID=585013 RepID=A0ABR3FPD1_9AGAR
MHGVGPGNCSILTSEWTRMKELFRSSRSSDPVSRPPPRRHTRTLHFLAVALSFGALYSFCTTPWTYQGIIPVEVQRGLLERCRSLQLEVGPPTDFHSRQESDRFVPGTKPTLIKDARIWTGSQNGTQVIEGDILLEKGLIKSIGAIPKSILSRYRDDELVIVDARRRWVTPGIVDVHSHIGVASSPALDGAADYDSLKGTISPWLRSLDGLNTHDDSYTLSISGGVTTALVLPGSANALGVVQAFQCTHQALTVTF